MAKTTEKLIDNENLNINNEDKGIEITPNYLSPRRGELNNGDLMLTNARIHNVFEDLETPEKIKIDKFED